ncbi:Hypothetical protein Eab7_2431 [Exiguobacterium antarcticum B7]|nr:Hypothetical protein Eab7_2431 [Exiguobacterium antarcticum B7]
MKETIQGTVIIVILCLMSILLIWGLSSPPTTIEFPLPYHSQPALSDVFDMVEALFFVTQKATVWCRFAQ